MTKLASIQTVKNLRKHPNADTLEICNILGWQVVCKSEIHKEGDKVVFIVIDTIVPKKPWSEFLVDKNNPDKPLRLKMVKLRGEHSAGIMIPLSEFPQFKDLEVGEDVSEALEIQKYIKELPANMSGDNVGNFPTNLASKTDEDNGLSNLDIVEYALKEPVTISLKLDGSSITLVYENGEIKEVCSRNLSKKDTPDSIFWQAARKLNKIEGFTGIVQGELVGNGIQKNPMKLEDREIYVFQIKKSSGEYMNYHEMRGFCNIELGCKVVPLVCETSFIGCDLQTALNKLQELADLQVYENSKKPAEGIVIRCAEYRKFPYELGSSSRPAGFKILNRNYKEN